MARRIRKIVLEPCSRPEFIDAIRDLSLKIEVGIESDRVVMRYVNRDAVVCACSVVDLRSGIESGWNVGREQQKQKRAPRRKMSPLPPDSVIFDSFFSGQSVREISDKYGVTKAPIYATLQKHSEYKKHKSNKSQEIIDLRSSGMTQTKIAKKYGVTRQAVSKILKYWQRKNNAT